MKSFGLTDKGMVRADNQDSFIIEKVQARDCLIVSEHPAGKPPAVPPEYAKERERDWGYCGVTMYRRKEEAPEEMI